MRLRIFLWYLTLIVILGFLFPPAAINAAEVSPEQLKEVGRMFVCNCNCGTQIDPLDESQCPTAKVFRKELEQMLKEGKSKEEIRDHYVAQFGESILRAPLKSGFSLSIWIIPFVCLAAGGGGLWFLIRRKMSQNRWKEPADHEGMLRESSMENELYQELIERERKKYL